MHVNSQVSSSRPQLSNNVHAGCSQLKFGNKELGVFSLPLDYLKARNFPYSVMATFIRDLLGLK